ncbi:hypothetical protein P4O66_015327 [Electrophorus voltai]|uniref:Reverse transcriptase domain-containing protein n=1 Tax=Electrophorus voltai TaxID=2609070 RepID=A0AAD8YYN1_9TELE|nr:hypothetical protein P4O66_015327 [Electrophorus voltai]
MATDRRGSTEETRWRTESQWGGEHLRGSMDTSKTLVTHWWRMWEGIQAITNYRKTSPSCDSDAILPDALNDFYARFEAQNNVAAEKSIPPQNVQVLCLTAADVRRTLRGVNALELLDQTTSRTTTIVPVPKKPTVSCLNDYRAIALTSIIMKCFERLVMRHIKTQLPPSLDPLQFAYCPNCSTDDAISTTLHLALTHLEKRAPT